MKVINIFVNIFFIAFYPQFYLSFHKIYFDRRQQNQTALYFQKSTVIWKQNFTFHKYEKK